MAILGKYGKWFLPDGMACFGFASHITNDEIYVMKYKIVRIYTRNLQKYQAMLEHFQVPREEKFKLYGKILRLKLREDAPWKPLTERRFMILSKN